jgi:hypothetical protein
MSIAKTIYNQLKNSPYSYGETLNTIFENNGKAISTLPKEDWLFEDGSVIRLTNQGVKVLDLLQE